MAKQMDRQKQSARKDTAKKTADKACASRKSGRLFFFKAKTQYICKKIRRQKPPKKSFYDEDFAFVRFEFTGNCRAFAALARPNFAERIFLL